MRIRCKKGNPNIPCPQYSVGTRSIEYPTCFTLQRFGFAVCLYGIAYPKQHTEVLLANVIPFAVFAALFGITAKKFAKPNKLSTFVKSSLKSSFLSQFLKVGKQIWVTDNFAFCQIQH